MQTFVAIDIGGTQLRVATYAHESQTPIQHARTPTHANGENPFDRLLALIESVWDDGVQAIGVSSAGPLDPHSGVILAPPNIKEWRNFPLTAKLTERFGVPAFLDNDANLAALAEWQFGAGRGHHDVLYLTISTGVGGGVIIADRLLQGYHGLAAELGHVTLEKDGAVCGCGGRGHLEAYSSGAGIKTFVDDQLRVRRVSSLSGGESAKEIAVAANAGDALARESFQRAGEYLGIAVSGFLVSFDPSIVILGGGVTQSGALLWEPFETSLKRHIFHPRYLEGLVLAQAELGDDAGLLGALTLARMNS